jgi:hypothetical protein
MERFFFSKPFPQRKVMFRPAGQSPLTLTTQNQMPLRERESCATTPEFQMDE